MVTGKPFANRRQIIETKVSKKIRVAEGRMRRIRTGSKSDNGDGVRLGLLEDVEDELGRGDVGLDG